MLVLKAAKRRDSYALGERETRAPLRAVGRLAAGLLIAWGAVACGAADSADTTDVGSQVSDVTATDALFINAGGPAVAPFSADELSTGGGTLKHSNVIDTSAVTGAAPAAVYQTARTGSFSYKLSGFTPNIARTVRLHFADTYFGTAGSRVFNVSINGAAVLSNFDIVAKAGAKNKAYIAELSKPADATGAFLITFQSVKDKSLVSGIEIPALPTNPTTGSAGCGLLPTSESSTAFAAHDVNVTGVNAIYLTGGALAVTDGPYNFAHRVYGVRLPVNYDPSKSYPVTFGGGGCGGNSANFAQNPSGGYPIVPAPNTETIQVGLSYLSPCFADGGPAISNRADTPELPYFRTVLADVEARFCVDPKRVFASGFSTGANLSFTLGCAAADALRGVSTLDGGMRNVHPACTGPAAAFMVVGQADTENPIGPLAATDPANLRNGSAGSAPGRDDFLARNGCVGNATAPWDAAYPACVKYTGCPAAYPVVWCSLPGVGHGGSTVNGVNYSPGGMWKFLSTLPSP